MRTRIVCGPCICLCNVPSCHKPARTRHPLRNRHYCLRRRRGVEEAKGTKWHGTSLFGKRGGRRRWFTRGIGMRAASAARRSAMSPSFAHSRLGNRPKMQGPFVLRTRGSASRRARTEGRAAIWSFPESRLGRKRTVRVSPRKTCVRVCKTRRHCIFGRFTQRTCAKLGDIARALHAPGCRCAAMPTPGQSASSLRSRRQAACPLCKRKPPGARGGERRADRSAPHAAAERRRGYGGAAGAGA